MPHLLARHRLSLPNIYMIARYSRSVKYMYCLSMDWGSFHIALLSSVTVVTMLYLVIRVPVLP
jgi:hypothetical protein